MKSEFDVIIVGQGLAGTALAWSLRWRGTRVLVVDREESGTCSKIAAGLVTPITGQKLIRTWRHQELWPYALGYYSRVESQTRTRFFRRTPMVRLFCSDAEARKFDLRQTAGEFDEIVGRVGSLVDDVCFDGNQSGFEMTDGGQLDVENYLWASRQFFRQDNGYVQADLQLSEDIKIGTDQVAIPRLNVVSKTLVFCQGCDARRNPWFQDVALKPAKGEILTLRIPGLKETRVIHRDVWLAPIGLGRFKAGSTYDWKNLDSHPTATGREEIISKLKEFLRLPFEIESHVAAVRPIHRNQYPVIGLHPQFRQLGYFNGLGSKGTLQAPYFANQFAKSLVEGGVIEPQVDLNLKTRWTSLTQIHGTIVDHVKRRRSPLTQQAQDAIRTVVLPGETAIDATAGNGYDTQFLAELVGPEGSVFAFDLQPLALQNTASRLRESNLDNVTLIEMDHSRLRELIPEQFHGRIAAVMFNLGYLPGGDKEITTTAASTRRAIQTAAYLLRQDGLMTVIAYTGHDGGASEAQVVEQVLSEFPESDWLIETVESQPGKVSGPKMFLARKRNSAEGTAEVSDESGLDHS